MPGSSHKFVARQILVGSTFSFSVQELTSYPDCIPNSERITALGSYAVADAGVQQRAGVFLVSVGLSGLF